MTNFTDQKAKPAAARLNFFDNFNEGKVSEWLEMHGKSVGYLLIGFLVLLTLIYFISKGFSSNSEKDYLQAANDFSVYSKSIETEDSLKSQEAYNKLKIMMSKHPELHAAYDGALAQSFLNQGKLVDARPYAEATFARTAPNHLEYYTDFAETTLLISGKKFQEALDKAKLLQTKMLDHSNFVTDNSTNIQNISSELFALNLLRIAMMQQELGDKAAELETWQTWKQYAGLKKGNSPSLNINTDAFRELTQQLAIGTVSLPDYIEYREKFLEPVQNL